MTSIAWHELTHASQLQRMKGEKNLVWASSHWSKVVYQQAKNELSAGSPYGKKGDDNWQIIALAEGWANYRQWYLSKKYLGYNDLGSYYDHVTNKNVDRYFDDYKNSNIAVYYGGLFDKLNKIGCSFQNLEKSLCAKSISEFKANIIAKYPTKKDQVNNIMKSYE